MDVELSRSHSEHPTGFPQPPDASRSSSRRSSITSERLYQIDDKAIPRKPGSARFRVLPNIIPKEISDVVDKDEDMAETSVTERGVANKDVRKPKKVEENERERKTQERKEKPPGNTILQDGTRNKGRNSLKGSAPANSLKGSAPATGETTLSKKSQQIGNLSQRTSDEKPAKATIEKRAKPVKGVGSNAKDSKERISPVRNIPPQDEKRITLAVKLPTGQRLQQTFRPSDPLQVILRFAESSSRCDFTGCELVCLEPKIVLRNMKKTIGQSNLCNKTLLYIQLPEPK